MGGIDSGALSQIYEWEGVENTILFTYKIQVYLSTLQQMQHEGVESGVKVHGQKSSQSHVRSRR